MTEVSPPEARVVILLGLPANVQSRTGVRLATLATKMKSITLRIQGSAEFELPTHVVERTLYALFDANKEKALRTIVLPYKATPLEPEIEGALKFLQEEMGGKVRRPVRGTQGWPTQPPRFDEQFHVVMLNALCAEISEAFREPVVETPQNVAAFEILRGLITKNKMGKGNNHSHWDDMWSSRGKDLGPGDRDAIVGSLLREKIIGTKSNTSAGGKGDVYWVKDVDKAIERFPGLKSFLGRE